MSKKILLTGGAGYIGSHVAKQLLEKTDAQILIIDNLSTGSIKTINTLKKIRKFDFIEVDLRDFAKIEEIFINNEIESILHFAASIIVEESVINPIKYYMNNTVNTANLVNMALKYKIKKFIFSSTAAVYGEPKNGIVKEDDCLKPINPYGRSKEMSEQIIQDLAFANNDFKFVILRYFNVAGSSKDGSIGQSFPNATHLIKIAVMSALKKREIMYIFGDDYDTKDGTCVRDYIHIDDLAKAHLLSLKYLDENDSGIFNVGYGHGFSVKEVIAKTKEISEIDFKVEIAPRRQGDPAILIANPNKIIKKMNFKPDFDDLGKICKSALEWEKKLK